jgi:hypothetical protein
VNLGRLSGICRAAPRRPIDARALNQAATPVRIDPIPEIARMRKTTRKTRAARHATTPRRKNRSTSGSRSPRWTNRSRRTTQSGAATRPNWPTLSPFAKAFIAGCRKGQPCSVVISAMSKRTGKSFSAICASLCRTGVCSGQKFNGQWICWPNFKTPTSAAWARKAQWIMWQNFADWCIASGNCTPANFNKFSATRNQAWFMKNCRDIMYRQCTIIGATSAKTPTTGPKAKASTRTRQWNSWTSKPLAWTRTFSFPTFKSITRRYARAA